MVFSEKLRERVEAAMDAVRMATGDRPRAWNDGGVEFRTVVTQADAAALLRDLSSPKRDRWPLDIWIDRALEPGRAAVILSARRTGGERSEAFGVWRTRETVLSEVGGRSLQVSLDAVYVTPCARGLGLGDAIGRTFVGWALEDLRNGGQQRQNGSAGVVFDGEAHSGGGAAIAASISAAIASGVADDPALLDVSYSDLFDYREFATVAEAIPRAPALRYG